MPDPVAVRLCFHDHCFDGAASAAIFSRFYRERVNPHPEFHYSGMTHRATQPFEDGIFDGDENVIVDFKYSSSPRVTWWFDHHQSAFLTPADAAHFRDDRSGHKFYDPDLQVLHQTAGRRDQQEIWLRCAPAGRADSLGRHHRRRAISHGRIGRGSGEPATQLGLVIEAAPEANLVPQADPGTGASLAGGDGEIADRGAAPGAAARAAQAIDRSAAGARGGGRRDVFFDVSDLDLEGYNKFIPYLLFPHCRYSVGVSSSRHAGEDFAGLESLERRVGGEESGVARRGIRRRRPSARRGDFAWRREISNARGRSREKSPNGCAAEAAGLTVRVRGRAIGHSNRRATCWFFRPEDRRWALRLQPRTFGCITLVI